MESESNKNKTAKDIFDEALEKFAKNRNEDVTVFSSIPETCKSTSCYVGIDEAGRGPVLGPMVYSIFSCVADTEIIKQKESKGNSINKIEENPPTFLDKISKLNDSKQVNEKTREEIFEHFSELDYIAFGIKIIAPVQISQKSYRRQKLSLNEISHNAAIELIQGLADRGVKMTKIYVDTVGPMEKYQKKLEATFPDLRFKVDTKADSKYKPVSAASICAKVTRDHALKDWTFTEVDNVKVGPTGWGSGYPGDEVTKKFLRNNIDPVFGFPNIVRDSWSTAFSLLEKSAVKIKWESDEPNDDVSTPKISKFFAKTQKTDLDGVDSPTIISKKSLFFSYRELEQTTSIF